MLSRSAGRHNRKSHLKYLYVQKPNVKVKYWVGRHETRAFEKLSLRRAIELRFVMPLLFRGCQGGFLSNNVKVDCDERWRVSSALYCFQHSHLLRGVLARSSVLLWNSGYNWALVALFGSVHSSRKGSGNLGQSLSVMGWYTPLDLGQTC